MEVALIFIVCFVISLLIGVPIAYALGIGVVGVVTLTNLPGIDMSLIIQTFFTSADTFPLLAVPFFILAGDIMLEGGISKRLVDFGKTMLGHVHGSLGLITVACCMLFAAISGSGPATTAAIGGILIPAMVKDGYDEGFSASCAAASGSLGPVIPPSITLIMYGIIASVSITDLFKAGILPGVFMGLCLMVFVYFAAKKNGFGTKTEKASGAERWKAFKSAVWAILVPVIILGGIYGGFVTPTEAAIIACDYAILVGFFVYKELTLKKLLKVFYKSALTSGYCLILVGTATAFGKVLTLAHIPQLLSDFVLGISDSKIIILLVINILLLIVGCFMETLAAVIILAPLLLAIVTPLGVDPIHFGVIMTCNLVIGQCTPPVGVNMFVASGVAGIPIERMFRWLFKFIAIMILSLLVITYCPTLSLAFL